MVSPYIKECLISTNDSVCLLFQRSFWHKFEPLVRIYLCYYCDVPNFVLIGGKVEY